jgi:hypothetical protein
MIDNSEDLDSVKDKILVKNNANTIFKKLEELENKGGEHKKRWFWELLQNAKDAVGKDETVSIKLVLKEDELSFYHTGNPFEKEDIIHVIFHGSSKSDDDEKTGRFGTGFMTTHLLSRKVNIKGELTNGEYFDFLLNRTSETIGEQDENLNISYNDLKKSITTENIFDDEYKTVFTYPLDEQGKKVVQNNIQQLALILPTTLAFNKKVQKVSIVEGDTVQVFEKTDTKEKDNFTEHHISKNGENHAIVFTHKTSNAEIAILLDKEDDDICIKELTDNYPRLFFDFPLFGTENMGFPIIINSTNFELYNERNGVYLGNDENNEEDNHNVKTNKLIIAEAVAEIPNIVALLCNKGIKNVENLFRFKSPDIRGIDNQWLNTLLVTTIDKLIALDFIRIENSLYSIEKIWFPYHLSNEYYNLTKSLYKRMLSYSEVEIWYSIIEELAAAKSKNLDDFEFIVTEKRICTRVEELESLENLQDKLGYNIDTFDWLNRLYKTFDSDLENLSYNDKIIPNQKGVFEYREDLDYDDKVDPTLKEIAKLLAICPKHKLVDRNIVQMDFMDIFTNEILLKEIDIKANDIDGISNNLIHGLGMLLKWRLDNESDLASLKKTKVITLSKNEEDRIRALYSPQKPLMSPIGFWEADFSLYSELVNHKFILHTKYFETLTIEDIKKLYRQKLVFTEPLIQQKVTPDEKMLEYLVEESDFDKISANENLKDKCLSSQVIISTIPYLTGEDSIISKSKVRLNQSLNLLKFIVLQVLNKDEFFDRKGEFESIGYEKSYWSSILKKSDWVNYKSPDKKSLSNTIPSTASISNLLNKDKEDELINYINKDENIEKVATFFNKLDISIADVLRNRLKKEEDKRAWDLTFTKMLTNKRLKNNPKLAQSILEDDDFIKKYEDRLERKERIKKNRQVGLHFESIFKEIFESSELNQTFNMERKTIGRDYEISNKALEENIPEFDSLDTKEKELILHINTNLIELKTTKVDYTQMSSIQGMDAVRHKDRFVLAVLPINDNKNHGEKYVKENVRFIVNIGTLLEGVSEIHEQYNSAKEAVRETAESIRLNLDGGNVRYRIDKEFWESDKAIGFDEFIEWLKNKEIKDIPNE